MTVNNTNTKIESIEIERIHILNPRSRNQQIFSDIVENIKRVGLKRPITVARSKSRIAGKDYDLVCGQGRIEALKACGQTHIPAIVIDEPEEMILLKSLVENLARRQHRPLDHLKSIKVLINKGYGPKIISQKTGLGEAYTKDIVHLLKNGEERLVVAVEAKHLPINVAIQIASSPANEQKALQEAYENNELRGEKLKIVQQLLESRRSRGKEAYDSRGRIRSDKKRKHLSGQDVIRIYQKEVDRKQMITRKANLISQQMLFISQALKQLCQQDHFTTLLRAEGLTTMPEALANLLDPIGD